jgi:Flp pilus assembly protein TadG
MRIRLLMTRLTRPARRRLPGRERGAIGVMVAVLIGGGVLVGMSALAVDVGQLYSERAQLQNGADSAALAVATTCSVGSCTPAISGQYANANAADGTSAVDLVCGTGMTNCRGSSGKLTDCPSSPADGTNFVDVHTSTLTSGGSTLLPPTFARTLLGNGNYTGTTVHACAQAEWGASSAAVTTSLTLSACDWAQATSDGNSYAPPPGNSAPSPSADVSLKLGASQGTGCASDPGSTDGAGTFGWTSDQSGDCSLSVQDSSSYDGSNGSVPTACQQALASAQANHTVLYVPVYNTCSHHGSSATYSLKGFAAFVVTGYSLPGAYAPDWLNSAHNCTKTQQCVNGYFTQGIIAAKSVPSSGCHLSHTTQDLGATWIKLTG